MSKIGILGGTFDPIHKGHIIIGENSLVQLELDCVYFMVSPDPPHKLNKDKTEFRHRYNMVRLALEGHENIFPWDYECNLPQPSYTINTIMALKKDYPDDQFMFIIGEDSLDQIEKWYRPADIMRETELIVAVRHYSDDDVKIDEQIDHLQEKYHCIIHKLDTDYIDISSTDIRKAVALHKDITTMVPESVADYIWKEKLYTT